MSAQADVEILAGELRAWLFREALPLWLEAGVDWTQGGFYELLDTQGRPIEAPRRTRVTGRQIYVFATAHRMGWTGDGLKAVAHGVDFLLRRSRREDGLFASSVEPSGEAVAADFDLYDHAFALFGLAAAEGLVAASQRPAEVAAATLALMRAAWSHPRAGFQEPMADLTLKANPHMHLLEASLVWIAALPGACAEWRRLAGEIAALARETLIDPRSGALRELFDADWRPKPGEAGRIVEPGHQFEWAWLLLKWAAAQPGGAAPAAALRLLQVGEAHGVNPRTGMAINELLDDFSLKDGGSRLWQQTERVKAWAFLAANRVGVSEGYALERTAEAARGLQRFLQRQRHGLWWDQMDEAGRMVEAPCRASSLYHIVGAIHQLDQFARAEA